MNRQLILIDEGERDWRIDDETREIGRRGIAAARDVLRSHRPIAGHVDQASEHPAHERRAA